MVGGDFNWVLNQSMDQSMDSYCSENDGWIAFD